MLKYTLTKKEPCAEYDGITIEGEFLTMIDTESCICTLKKKGFNVNRINGDALILAQQENVGIYIYEYRKFIISKIKDKKVAEIIINDIICASEKQMSIFRGG